MDSELDNIFHENSAKESQELKRIYYEGVYLPEDYLNIKEDMENFEVRDDDVWVCSFPKTGTTWTQEMVWCIANNLDFDAAKSPILKRYIYLETPATSPIHCIIQRKYDMKISSNQNIELAKKSTSPRFIRSHLHFHLLPRQLRTGEKSAKIIYVTRNSKDTCISHFHHSKFKDGYYGTFDNFCKLFLGDRIINSPFWEHVIGYWKKKDEKNILFLTYEEMKADLPSVIRKTANFLGKSLDNQQVNTLAEHLSFASMKANPAVNFESGFEKSKFKIFEHYSTTEKFMRSGTTDQWKTRMSQEIIKRFDEWTAEKLKDYPDVKAELS